MCGAIFGRGVIILDVRVPLNHPFEHGWQKFFHRWILINLKTYSMQQPKNRLISQDYKPSQGQLNCYWAEMDKVDLK
jgi:hypothetical protein